jgi:predicted phosphodiesterase
MIRLAALADIHGNIPALEAVLEDLQSVELHGLIAAGDLINGPQPVETSHRLQQLRRSLECWMIRGNGELSLLQYATGKRPAYWQTCRQFAFVRWNYRQLDEETLDFMSALPEQAVIQVTGAPSIRVVHGSPRDAGEEIFPARNPGHRNRPTIYNVQEKQLHPLYPL